MLSRGAAAPRVPPSTGMGHPQKAPGGMEPVGPRSVLPCVSWGMAQQGHPRGGPWCIAPIVGVWGSLHAALATGRALLRASPALAGAQEGSELWGSAPRGRLVLGGSAGPQLVGLQSSLQPSMLLDVRQDWISYFNY